MIEEITATRTPPSDKIAEQSVLGATMLSPAATGDAIEVLRPHDFYVPRHALIFAAILALYSHGEPNDVVAVTDQLLKTGELDRAGGADYLHELTAIVPTAANAGYYARIVGEKAVLRRLVDAGTRIAQMGYQAEGSPADLVEAARVEVDGASAISASELVPMSDAFDQWASIIEQAPTAVPTPWRDLNSMLGGGLQPGRLYVIGARPSEGKSMMGLQLADCLVQTGPVAFASLEMTRAELVNRLVSMRANIHMSVLAKRQLGHEHWSKIRQVRAEVQDLPLFIDDKSDITVTGIQAFARKVARRGPLAGVVVDYLQLISGPANQDRHVVVGEISRRLKIMAKELRCPVIALAQLNRESVAGKGRREPGLSDLRESGSIEQDADVVLLNQRQIDRDGKPSQYLTVIAAKNRSGPTGRTNLLWEGGFSRVSQPGWMGGDTLPDQG